MPSEIKKSQRVLAFFWRGFVGDGLVVFKKTEVQWISNRLGLLVEGDKACNIVQIWYYIYIEVSKATEKE